MDVKERIMIKNMKKMAFADESEIKKIITFLKSYNFTNNTIKSYMIDFMEKKLILYRINKTVSVKVKFHLQGLFNLVNEKNNYNNKWVKYDILKDLKAIKSFNDFKIVNVSQYNLQDEFKYLTYKNDATLNHSKIIRLNKNSYIIKTVLIDGLNLKLITPSFMIKKMEKKLLKSYRKKPDFKKEVGEPSNFNLSSTNAWKALDKDDNIRFYGYCNRNGLDKSNRDLLKSIRKYESKKSFNVYLEDVEMVLKELEDKYASNPHDYELWDELEEVKLHYWSLTEEDNTLSSDKHKTTLGDYFPPMWKENKL